MSDQYHIIQDVLCFNLIIGEKIYLFVKVNLIFFSF